MVALAPYSFIAPWITGLPRMDTRTAIPSTLRCLVEGPLTPAVARWWTLTVTADVTATVTYTSAITPRFGPVYGCCPSTESHRAPNAQRITAPISAVRSGGLGSN